ncbi:phage-like element PBSX protein xkdS [Lachnospiraceae bacterium KM106-2]|nr:phage-like element PBSX protein xkdS [Lachnospiraceae bacterium KM106-2]
MSFPFEVDEDEIESEDLDESINNKVEYEIPKEYEVDLKTGNLTGRVVEGLDAIKSWVYFALRTKRYQHEIFSWEHGNELEDLIGSSHTQEYYEAEVPRMIKECLMENKYITDVTNFMIQASSDQLNCSFTIETSYGEVEMSV